MIFDDVKFARLREMTKAGVSTRKIAQEFGIAKSYAHKLVQKIGRSTDFKPYDNRGVAPESDAGRFIAANAGKMSDPDIALACGVTHHQVRNFRYRHKLQAYRREAKPAVDAKPFVLESRFIAANDQEAIAEFIARRGVTVCPPGTACGLSAIERHLYAAKPPTKDYTAWQARRAARAGR